MSRHTNRPWHRDAGPPGIVSRADALSRDREFDLAARRCHTDALAALTPQTLSRLRAARHGATSAATSRRSVLGWVLASSSAAVIALAVSVQLQRVPIAAAPSIATAVNAPTGNPDATAAIDDYADLVGGLDENPDLYLWLAANHDTLPATGATP